MPTTYKLSTIRDIFEQIPSDRVEACLTEMIVIIKQAHAIRDLMNAAGKAEGVDLGWRFQDPLQWIDDGRADISIRVHDGKSEEPVMTFDTRRKT